jgi:DNA-directed RNA polymerase subunit RPC12/RpoP
MPATLDVSCPNCGKQLKVPAELEGKKVKCKDCQEVFAVKAPKKAAPPKGKAAPAKPAPKAAPKAEAPTPPKPEEKPKSPFLDEEDEEDLAPGQVPKPMEVIRESDAARCPHCANELDPPDAVVCIHCGFNNKTRVKGETKKVIEADATDWITHLAPGIIALIIVIGLIVVDIVCAVNMRGWMEGGALEQEEVDLTGRKKMFIHPGAFIAAIVAASIFIIVPAGKFAFRRLVLNAKPEEKVKK